jgi:FHA domain/zinc-ribbon domain
MPFCTQCGHQNPDGARFCSQCGTRLESSDDPGSRPAGPAPTGEGPAAPESGPGAGSGDGSGEGPGETTATMTFGGPTKEGAEHREERSLNDADAAAVDALPAGSALLVVQRGPSAGSRFLLDTDVVSAGRHPDSEIFLDDVTVSRRHAEFRRTAEGYTVADVGSLNGTYVNRDRIDEVALQGGDEVQIGKYRLVCFASHTRAGR